MGAKLIQLTGTRASYALEKKITTIGRGPENDIVIRDERVSKQHARIVKQGTEYYLEDLDSRNGTFFEGKSILKVHLQADDEFQVGPIAFQFVATVEAEKREPVSTDYSELREVQRGNLPSWVYFYYPVIRALNNGEIISTVVAFVFQLVGVLMLAGGIYYIIDFLKLVFQMPTDVTIGGIILSILQLAAFFAIVEIFFYRARNIKDLGASSYTVIPIFGYLFRALGESMATMGVATAVGGCIFIWFGGDPLYRSTAGVFHLLYPERIFLSGLVYLLLMVAFSFIILIVAYVFAESFTVSVDIEKNVRALRTRAEHVGKE
jgi:hypothetical protein